MNVPKIIKVSIWQDPDCQDPTKDACQWSIYTFKDKRLHLVTDVDRGRFYDEYEETVDVDLEKKLQTGLAFGLNYGSHGPQCDYRAVESPDMERIDGVIVWEHDPSEIGAKTPVDRLKDAESFLEEYTRWANGDCFGYSIERLQSVTPEYDAESDLDNGAYWEPSDEGCWGLIGFDYARETIEYDLKSYEGYRVVYGGDAAHIMR